MVVGGLASFADYALDLPTLPVQINPGDEFFLASRYDLVHCFLSSHRGSREDYMQPPGPCNVAWLEADDR
jgi:hypothetical protein